MQKSGAASTQFGKSLFPEKEAPLKQNSGDGRKKWLTLNGS
jgi:hypothetical protein